MGEKKTKKRKAELSQAEIWDDSALVRSWDDALAEYKKYHSIHVQGHQMKDVTESLNDNSEQADEAIDIAQRGTISPCEDRADDVDLELLEDGELKDDESEAMIEKLTKEAPKKAGSERKYDKARGDQHPFVTGVPIAVSNGAQDEALKNLMMSWYYAGYYTGLYEGQTLPKGHPTG